MSNPLVDAMAARFIEEVRDRVLRGCEPHFLGNLAVVRNNRTFVGLVARLDDAQKDLLWALLAETVDQTIDGVLRFVDHKRVTGEMRVALGDPDGSAETVLSQEDDLADLYWCEWLERHARVTARPRTRVERIGRDELPAALLAAVAEDFPGERIVSQEREVGIEDGSTILYHVLLTGQASPIAFRPDGGRARVA